MFHNSRLSVSPAHLPNFSSIQPAPQPDCRPSPPPSVCVRVSQPGYLGQVFGGATAHQYHAVCRAIVCCNRDLDLSRQAPVGVAIISRRHTHPGADRHRGLPRIPYFCHRHVRLPRRLTPSFIEPAVVGWHFAALEQPDLMLADLRAFISTVAERSVEGGILRFRGSSSLSYAARLQRDASPRDCRLASTQGRRSLGLLQSDRWNG